MVCNIFTKRHWPPGGTVILFFKMSGYGLCSEALSVFAEWETHNRYPFFIEREYQKVKILITTFVLKLKAIIFKFLSIMLFLGIRFDNRKTKGLSIRSVKISLYLTLSTSI